MKRIYFILIILFSFGQAEAQDKVDFLRTKVDGNRNIVDARLRLSHSLNIPRGASWSLNGAKDSIGYVMFNTTLQRFGVYHGSGIWKAYAIQDDLTDISDGWLPLTAGISKPLTGDLYGTNINLSGTIKSSGADLRNQGDLSPIGVIIESIYTVAGNPKTLFTGYGESLIRGGIEFRHVNGSGANTITSAYANPSGDWIFYNNTNLSSQTASRVLVTDASKNVISSSVSATTLGYLDATSSIQTQLNSKIGLSSLSATSPVQYNSGTGVISINLSGTSPIQYNSGTGAISIPTASGSQTGALSSTDWTNFNSKESALTFSTGLSRSSNTITINQGFSPTWTGTHTFNTAIASNGADLRNQGAQTPIGLVFTSEYTVPSNPKSVITSYGQSTARGGIEFRIVNGSGGDQLVPLYINSVGELSSPYSITANSFIKSGGTSSQYLMADGSVTTAAAVPTLDQVLTSGNTSSLPFYTSTHIITNGALVASTSGLSSQVLTVSASGSNSPAAKITSTVVSGSTGNILNLESNSGPVLTVANNGALTGTSALFTGDLAVGSSSQGRHIDLFISGPLDGKIYWGAAGNPRNMWIGGDGTPRISAQVGGSGGVTLTSGATSWASLSDENLKEMDEFNPFTNALSKVSSLRAGTTRYKTDSIGISRSFLIAQDVQSVLPEAVSADPTGELSLRYTEVIPLLVAAIKEIKLRIEALEQ